MMDTWWADTEWTTGEWGTSSSSPIIFAADWSVWNATDRALMQVMQKIGLAKTLWCEWEAV